MVAAFMRVRWALALGLGLGPGLGLGLGLGCGSRATEADAQAEAEPKAATREAEAAPTVTAAWPEHTSTACAFAVQLPTPLSIQPAPPGLLDQLAYEDPLQPLTLLASCGDVPSVGSPAEFLDVTAEVIATQMKATVDTRTEVQLQGRPGLALSMTIPAERKPPAMPWSGDLIYRLRLYVAGRRQYQLHVLHPAGASLDDSPERFFAGFRLLDDAPAAPAPLAWGAQTIDGVTVEVPGTPVPEEPAADGLVQHVRFEGNDGRPTPYAVSLWTAALPGALDDPTQRLRAHFMLRVATKDAEIVAETPTEVAGRPALDVTYRPRLPLPEHLAPDDARTRAAVEELIAQRPTELRLRLVLDGDRIVQLRAANPASPEEAARFLGSLVLPSREG
ncbi:MAG: hypothetical protein KDK70_20835 [Myxococcales bacterium]|nr:hypothetical protein [Myxococcales bacterium]